MSTTVIPSRTDPNPTYGFSYIPEVGESKIWQRTHEGYSPQYIRGLCPIPEGILDFTGLYTKEDSERLSDEDTAPRRRCPRKETTGGERTHPRGHQRSVAQSIEEMIRAHEAQIQKLKHNLKMRQPRHMLRTGGSGVWTDAAPSIDLGDPPRRRRAEIPRADSNDLLPLGEPDDPTPPFTEEIMNTHILRKFKMLTIKAYDWTGDPENHVTKFSNALLLQSVNGAIKLGCFL